MEWTRPVQNANYQKTVIDGCVVAHEWIGQPSPQPVVFLHGLGDSSIITFRRFAVVLAEDGFASLLVDLPGFGFSTTPDAWPSTTEDQAQLVATLLDRLGISRASIVAHSMGGSIAILIAESRADLVSQLIVAEPLLLPEYSALGKSVAKRTERWFVERGFAMLQLATRRQAARGDVAAREFVQPLVQANPVIMHRSAVSLLIPRSPSFRDRLIRLSRPRTLIIGARSEQANMVANDLPGAGVVVTVVPNAGHSMMTENPEAFATALRDTLR